MTYEKFIKLKNIFRYKDKNYDNTTNNGYHREENVQLFYEINDPLEIIQYFILSYIKTIF